MSDIVEQLRDEAAKVSIERAGGKTVSSRDATGSVIWRAAEEIERLQRERDHFYNQWRACWAPLTPMSGNEKRGFNRVLAILKSKLSDGGGIVGPSEVQRAHNDYYRGRRTAFEECAEMLRLALEAEASPQPRTPPRGLDDGQSHEVMAKGHAAGWRHALDAAIYTATSVLADLIVADVRDLQEAHGKLVDALTGLYDRATSSQTQSDGES